MAYKLIQDIILHIERFEAETKEEQHDLASFSDWLYENNHAESHSPIKLPEPTWEGKENGRSAESIINTLLVHIYRYARLHGKAIIADSPFATSDEFIYLINLRFMGSMSKTSLIKHNIHEKPAGIQIINRLITNGWVTQSNDPRDKRGKIISITKSGGDVLDKHMQDIRIASKMVTGNLTYEEKMQLISLLLKLEEFHNTAYKNDTILNAFQQAKV